MTASAICILVSAFNNNNNNNNNNKVIYTAQSVDSILKRKVFSLSLIRPVTCPVNVAQPADCISLFVRHLLMLENFKNCEKFKTLIHKCIQGNSSYKAM